MLDRRSSSSVFAILCAIIDFSMAVFVRNSLILAVREGARYAVTGANRLRWRGLPRRFHQERRQTNAMVY